MEGRPTEYKQQYNKQAEKLCRLGATDKELADFFGVVESTINEWKLKHPGFSESIKKGKVVSDIEVSESLHKRALAGDVTAQIFWLKNRQKKHWRDKVEHGFTDGDGNDVSPVHFYIPDNGREGKND